MKRNKLYKSFSAKPYLVLDSKGNEVTRGQYQVDIIKDLELITEYSSWIIRNDDSLLDDVRNSSIGIPNECGRSIGIGFSTDILADFKSGKSRYSKLLADRVVREVFSWSERDKAFNGSGDKYMSQGWKRTVNPSKPTDLNYKYSLSAASHQFCKIINNPYQEGFVEMKLVIQGEWHTLYFSVDTKRFDGCRKICLPDVTLDKKGNPIFHFAVEYDYIYSDISSKYIIGVDVGISNYATVSVFDVENNIPVHVSTLSQRVHSLYNSIRASDKQKNKLRNLDKFSESKLHRESSSRKKRELAILAAQEVADIANIYDNAVIVFEDLSWIKNTMNNGRWNRGELIKWTEHFHGFNSGRVTKVNPAYTSQLCWQCGEKLIGSWHDKVCSEHGLIDRDVNASINIAKRAFEKGTVDKIAKTRKKNRKFSKEKVFRTPVTKDSLKYPGRDRTKNRPTPKRLSKKQHSKIMEVNFKKISSAYCDDDSRVCADDRFESESSIRTLEKQLEFSKDKTIFNSLS